MSKTETSTNTNSRINIELGDLVIAPNGHEYDVRDVYVGAGGVTIAKLYDPHNNHTMYPTKQRLEGFCQVDDSRSESSGQSFSSENDERGEWGYYANGGDTNGLLRIGN